jgi:hypothetical protein
MPKDHNGNYVAVYHLDVRYIYLSKEPGDKGMREKSMTQYFIADNHYQAVVSAVAWAKGRFEAVIKDSYKNASIGSITVGEYFIGDLQPDSRISSGYAGHFFEWKCDFPITLEDCMNCKKETLEKYLRKT